MFFLYVGKCQLGYIASHSRRQYVSQICCVYSVVSIGSGRIHNRVPGKVSWPEAKLGVMDSSRLLSTILMNLYRYKVTRSVVRGLQEAAIHPLQTWVHLLGVCKISKKNVPFCPLKNYHALLHLRVASVEP